MNRSTLLDLLAEHADALNRSDDVARFDSETWLSSRYLTGLGQILPLLQLAQAVKRALVPVPTSSSFRAELRQQLALGTNGFYPAGRSYGHYLVLVGAAAVGLSVLILRLLKPGQKPDRLQGENGASMDLAPISLPEQSLLS